jgi:ribonuclease P protein subunit POP4
MERHELIGNDITVTKSPNPELVGIHGRIIDETRNTLTIATHDGSRKMLVKDQITFTVGDIATIQGKDITFRPEDRTKRK